MEGVVTETNKGGVIVLVKGVKVFVPRSQATMRRDEDINALVKQNVKLVITECAGRKIVGSINKVTAEANAAKREAFWSTVEVGNTYTGVVKSLTAYGAFVDVGGVDGLCHISELSWNRIKHPSEVVSVGDTIEVYVKALDTREPQGFPGLQEGRGQPLGQAAERVSHRQRVHRSRGEHHQVRRLRAHPARHRRPGPHQRDQQRAC